MKITTNYYSNPEYEAMYDDLIKETFGFSFAPWFERKLWDERYESYSIIENGRMLSNISIFKTNLLVVGKPVRAHQYGAVATRKSWRGKGLSRVIMEHINSLYPDVPAFLSANPSVLDFYPRFGFRRVTEYRPALDAKIDNPTAPIIMLKPDDEAVQSAIQNRTAYSSLVDSVNTQSVQMFHLLLEYTDAIYHLPKSDVVVVAEQTDEKLFVADVISDKPLKWSDIAAELPFVGVQRIEFGFCPDWLGVNAAWEPISGDGDPFFIKGSLELPERFIFPITSRT